MTGQEGRTARVLTLLDGVDRSQGDAAALCTVAASVSGTTGASFVLADQGRPMVGVGATGPVSAEVVSLQVTCGEGPSIDAVATGQPVAAPDLTARHDVPWVVFAPAAVAAGACAVFAVPLHIGGVRFGTLELQRDRPGALRGDQQADAVAVADLAARMLLTAQAEAPPGELAPDLDAGVSLQLVVHQASGMVAVQTASTVADALVRMRAHAFRTGRPLADVATDVVERILRFTPEDGP